jgi:all-trans-retinol dehydrogenase (NAD+)
MKKISDKKVLVTGGGSGVGKALSLKLAKMGAVVLVLDINLEAAQSVAQSINSSGGKAHAFHVDLSNLDSIKKCRSEITAKGILIDILVNNAGVVSGGEFEKISLEKHFQMYRINTEAVVAMTHLFFADLRQSKDANIVNIASASAFIGLPYGATYASSKSAVVGFSESFRLELIERSITNVHVTTVCPSFISTGMFEGAKAPIIVPWITADYVADQVIYGIQYNKEFIKAPFMVKCIDLLKGVLPLRVFVFLNKFLGVSTSMTHWKGRES